MHSRTVAAQPERTKVSAARRDAKSFKAAILMGSSVTTWSALFCSLACGAAREVLHGAPCRPGASARGRFARGCSASGRRPRPQASRGGALSGTAVALADAGCCANGTIGPPGMGARIQSENIGDGPRPRSGGGEGGCAAAAVGMLWGALSVPQKVQLPSGRRRGWSGQLPHFGGGGMPTRCGLSIIVVADYFQQAVT